LNGIYDPHNNVMQYPAIMQPTHARWEIAPDAADEATSGINGISLNAHTQDDEKFPASDAPAPSIFAPVKPIYARNFLIVDTMYENPSSSHLGVPGPDGGDYDLGFNGLAGIPDDIKNELPLECRQAFDKALNKEIEWKSRWGTEALDSKRKAPIIDKGLIL
jgi:chromatin structure-remodeling complex protein RSC7